MTTELTALAWTLVLAVVQIFLPAGFRNRETGLAYNAGPRDTEPAFSPLTGRLRRAVSNHFENLILFTIAVVVVTLSGSASATTAACAWLYLAARVAYVPAYAFGWSPWRSAWRWAAAAPSWDRRSSRSMLAARGCRSASRAPSPPSAEGRGGRAAVP